MLDGVIKELLEQAAKPDATRQQKERAVIITIAIIIGMFALVALGILVAWFCFSLASELR